MNFSLFPPQASDHAAQHDWLFYTISALTVFFTLGVYVAVLILVIRYRSGNRVDRSHAPHENLKLEIAWSGIPLLLALGVFAWGAKQFVDIRIPPKNAMNVYVIGKQWMWHIQHSNGVRENNTLHLPAGQPVMFTMISQDVIHAFYIPAFRIQYHVVPGRYTMQWTTPTVPGKYHLFCAMHCGTQHSEMGGWVYVMPPADFQRWLAKGGDDVAAAHLTAEEQGADIYKKYACANCHGATDTPRGPSLYAIMGKTRKFTDGTSTVADIAYIRESIINPYAKMTAGYDNTMPVYAGQITEEQILQVIAYLNTLGGAMPNQTSTNSAPTTPGANSPSPAAPQAKGGANP